MILVGENVNPLASGIPQLLSAHIHIDMRLKVFLMCGFVMDPKSAVTEMLDGNSDFTLEGLFSLADALDHDLEISFRERRGNVVELGPMLGRRARHVGKREGQELEGGMAVG